MYSDDMQTTTLHETAPQNFARSRCSCPMQIAIDTALGVMKCIILGRVSSSPLHIAYVFLSVDLAKRGLQKTSGGGKDQTL
jgi:hypothetical protein